MTSKRSLGSRFHGNDITSVPRTSKRGRGIVSSFGIAGGRGGAEVDVDERVVAGLYGLFY